MRERLYIVVPAYNEAENIGRLIDEWYPIVEKHNGGGTSRLVIINDGSRDNTYDIVCSYAKERPLLQPLSKQNGGHRSTVLYGYRYAIQNEADYIFQTDSDGQTDPSEFDAFWKMREEYDAVIGSRSTRHDGISRKLVEKVLLVLLKVVFGVSLPDSNAPFRLMKREVLERYIKKMPADFNLPNVMLTTYFAYFKEKVKFVEISFKPRQGGTNSINIKKIIKIGWKAIYDFRDLKRHINN